MSNKAQPGLNAALGFVPSGAAWRVLSPLQGAPHSLSPPHLMDHDFTSTTFDDEPFQHHETFVASPNLACPACQSPRTIPRDTGKKAGAAIGAVAGAAGGISGALSGAITGAEIGMAMAAAATTSTTPFGIVAGAILGGLSGGIAGCTVGAALGEAIDDALLRNRRCLACGQIFSVSRR